MRILDFKSFYAIYKDALIDKGLTSSVKSIFAPILDSRDFPNNPRKPEENIPFEITTNHASEWTSNRQVRGDIAKAAQQVELRQSIVDHFNNVIVMEELDEDAIDGMIDEMMDLVVDSDLDADKKDQLRHFIDENEIGEFLAQTFIYSLAKVTKSRGRVMPSEPTTEAIDEFEKMIRKRYTKPETQVPQNVDEAEMEYVNALLAAYEEASGESFSDPEDVHDSEYEGHFRQQRKNYYQAETIHRAIRDTVRKDDKGFDTLKEEIEDGVYTEAHAKYPNGLEKADAVLSASVKVQISQNTDDYMLGWVGPGERRGVCHMLVNDHKLSWVEDDENEK